MYKISVKIMKLMDLWLRILLLGKLSKDLDVLRMNTQLNLNSFKLIVKVRIYLVYKIKSTQNLKKQMLN